MQTLLRDPASVAAERLARCYAGNACDWARFYRPRKQMLNFATRYHLVYPALAYFVEIKRDPKQAGGLRRQLDTIYKGLLEPRCWSYWHEELHEASWPLQERNLTYAGRLATFIGFYIDAFGEPPAERIELDGRSTTYSELSRNLHDQMVRSPSCGVSCYHHQSMVMCNAHMLINNVLHDRLFATTHAKANSRWLRTVEDKLLRREASGPIFFFGTQPDREEPMEEKQAVGADFWALFLMSAVVPNRVAEWFERAQRNVVDDGWSAHVQVAAWEAESEFSCDALATAWAFCLAKELGQAERATRFQCYLRSKVAGGFNLEPYISGLYLLGERLEQGSFQELVVGQTAMADAWHS